MDIKFCPISTEDGSISLYNFEIKDVYHSKIGAYTEALKKYTIPSGILEFVQCHNEIRIVDICFGLGYNSKVAIAEILKINPDCKIHVDAVEMDINVLVLSCILSANMISEIEYSFFEAISKVINLECTIKNFFEKLHKYWPYFEENLPSGYSLLTEDEINQKLHNIYYRTISTRNSREFESNHVNDRLTIKVHVNDARKVIPALDGKYDFIFHDPFTPSRAPVLWTVEFFRKLHDLLGDHGNLTTYSSAVPIRSGLIEAGFCVGNTEPVGKKTPGTIAYKNYDLIKFPLSEKEKGLIKTNAGIPYYDENFSDNFETILKRRDLMQKTSGRISTGSFLKNFDNSL